MKTSQKGIDLIKQFEGCSLTAYQDIAGVWTIGYGNTYYLDGTKVQKGDKITQTQAEAGLVNLLPKYEDPVNTYCMEQGITLNQNQWDSIISARWNLGNVKTQLDDIKAGTLTKDIWCSYDNAGGQFSQGLYNRRVIEWELFTTPIVTSVPIAVDNTTTKINQIKSLVEQINNILTTI